MESRYLFSSSLLYSYMASVYLFSSSLPYSFMV
jgi:hypothetical protein